ncbi:MAG: hypothetical protein ACRDDF_01675 [Aeromonas sp.]
MNNTFIKMLAAIEDPAAIERAYQMMAAKRELLARNAEKTREFNLRYGDEKGFKHSTMEPRPLPDVRKVSFPSLAEHFTAMAADVKCPDMVEMARVKAASAMTEAERVAAPYKLAPSLSDIQFTRNMVGMFRLEIYDATPDMVASGFNTGDLFTMESVGYNRSTVRSVKQPKRTAVVHNRYLRVVFTTPTGGRYRFPN